MDIELEEIVVKVREIARKAGFAILDIYKNEDLEITHKSDQSPLTLADQKSNDCIVEGLTILTPAIPIISEEEAQTDYEARKKYNYCWIVDPLDGTKEFIKRNGEFTVNIALAKNGKIVLGVVYVPVSQELFWATLNEGAFKEDLTNTRHQIKASTFKTTDRKLKVVCSRSHLNEATQSYIDHLDEPQLIPKGSSLKMMEIAEGKADIYPRFGPTMEWDTAASQIIVEEAGGQLLDIESDVALQYNKENLLNPHFIVFGNKID